LLERAAAAAPATGRLGGLALLVSLAVVWGVNWPAMKLALAEVDVWSFRALCAAGGGLMFLALLRASGRRLRVAPAERRPLALAALFNITLWPVASAIALTTYPAGPSAIVAYVMPAIAAGLGSLVLKERFTTRRLAALALGMGGLVALLAPRGGVPPGAAWMLFGACLWAVGTILLKRTRWTTPTAVMSAWQIFIGGLPIVLIAIPLGDWDAWARLSPVGTAALAYSVVLGVIVGQWLWFRLVGMLPIAVAGVCSLAVPPVGVLSGALLLGERVGWPELLALTLVTAAIGLVLFERRPK
jgi:drug/metabolite transporter (DMT)-like permease